MDLKQKDKFFWSDLDLPPPDLTKYNYSDEFRVGNFVNRTRFIEGRMRLVASVASAFKSDYFESNDFVNEAMIALCKIPDEVHKGRYDSTKAGLDTYTCVRARTACRSLLTKSGLIKIPKRELSKVNLVLRRTVPVHLESVFREAKADGYDDILDLIPDKEVKPLFYELVTPQNLTVAESQVLSYLRQGKNIPDIARLLGISYNTVKRRVDALKPKLTHYKTTYSDGTVKVEKA